MKIFSYYTKGFLVIAVSLSVFLNPFYSYSQGMEQKAEGYSHQVKTIANNIVLSHFLFEEAVGFYKKRDYVNAKLKLEEALARDFQNKKAKKFLKKVNRAAKKEEKKRKRKELKLENRALGVF
ncbi:MAG: hypothetical protein HQ579_08875, partial [Candidatus Omnitrophica bacterium]|nr:hypothetical protein [Candidatus Omnitrophota bacterium]